jgi:hypothetical protein
MNDSEEFQAGQRVKVRASADSEFAGHQGTVVYVGSKACDVRIRYKPQGSKTVSTFIGTFQKKDLESLRKGLDLAHFSEGGGRHSLRQYIWRIFWLAGLVIIGGCVIWRFG